MKTEIANRVADTNNKIAQLPILGQQKIKLQNEVDRLIRSNRFIELDATQKLAVQKATVKSIQVATELTRKKTVTEDFNQEQMYAEIRKTIKSQYQGQNIAEDFTEQILGIIKGLIPKF